MFLTSLRGGERIGSQEPRIELVPDARSRADAEDAIDLAAAAGLVLDPWQERVLRGSLGVNERGKWSAFRTALVVPRQNGKNAVLEARELAGLFLFGERLIIHTAHQYRTVKGAMKSMMNRIRACPDLLEQVWGFDGDPLNVPGFKTGNNEPGIRLKSGAELQYFTRSKDGGRGFTGDLVVLDEAYSLKLDEMAALVPTMAATSVQGNPQLWFTSSAGMPGSEQLAALRESGQSGAARLAYFEWSAADDAAVDDRDAWFQANPGLGIRISAEYVEDELDTLVQESGSEEQFKRERLGIWARLGGESLFPAGAWEALADEGSRPAERLVFAVDVAPARDAASIGLVSLRADGVAHVEVVENRDGTSWLPARLDELAGAYPQARLVALAGGSVEALVPGMARATARRLKLLRFADYAKACGLFFDHVAQARLQHLGDPVLGEAVAGAAQSWSRGGDSWVWSRRSSQVDISPLVAVTLGLWVAVSRGPEREKRKAVIL